MPKRARTDPTGSSGVTWLSRDFGENRATATAATTTRGRLTRIAGAPPELLQQCAGDHRADGGAGPGEAGPRGDGPGPLLGREHRRDDRQRGGHDERRADAHDPAADDDLPGRRGQPGDQEAPAEHAEPAEEGPLAPEPVAEGPGGQEQPGEHEGVRVDDPVELGGGGAQVLLQAGGRHVEGRDRHDDEDEGQAHDPEEEPAATVDVGVFEQLGDRVVDTHSAKRIRCAVERNRFIM